MKTVELIDGPEVGKTLSLPDHVNEFDVSQYLKNHWTLAGVTYTVYRFKSIDWSLGPLYQYWEKHVACVGESPKYVEMQDKDTSYAVNSDMFKDFDNWFKLQLLRFYPRSPQVINEIHKLGLHVIWNRRASLAGLGAVDLNGLHELSLAFSELGITFEWPDNVFLPDCK